MEFSVQCKEIRGAVAEMVKESSFRQAGFLHDEIDAQTGQPGALGQPQSGVDERFSGFGHCLLAPPLGVTGGIEVMQAL